MGNIIGNALKSLGRLLRASVVVAIRLADGTVQFVRRLVFGTAPDPQIESVDQPDPIGETAADSAASHRLALAADIIEAARIYRDCPGDAMRALGRRCGSAEFVWFLDLSPVDRSLIVGLEPADVAGHLDGSQIIRGLPVRQTATIKMPMPPAPDALIPAMDPEGGAYRPEHSPLVMLRPPAGMGIAWVDDDLRRCPHGLFGWLSGAVDQQTMKSNRRRPSLDEVGLKTAVLNDQ